MWLFCIVCGFEEEDSLENLHFVLFCPIKSVLFNLVCVLDLARLVQKRATQYCVKVSSFAELSTNTCTLVCSFDFVALGSGAFD